VKIPESVRIGGVEYAISYVENLRNGNQLAYGYIDYDNCKIELSATDGIGHQKRCQTLLHEILHGVRQHAGLEIENEEAVIEMFAKGIYQVLQDNGGRLFDLMETDKKGKSNEKVHASGF
jgi:hypothetical protein